MYLTDKLNIGEESKISPLSVFHVQNKGGAAVVCKSSRIRLVRDGTCRGFCTVNARSLAL